MKQKGLGRGLDALLAGNESPVREQQRSLPVAHLQPGKYQPRTQMDNASLEELAASIRAQGLMQPILVRPIGGALGEDRYEIIAGERRWRAAQMAGLTEVPTLIREIPDESALAMALIENIQRENLNPLEEAQGLQRLVDEFSMTHQEAADAVGRSRPAASNLLRLLQLVPPVQEMLMRNEIDMGHARVLAGVDNAVDQLAVYEQILSEGLSVHATEDLVKASPEIKSGTPKAIKKGALTNETYSSLATELTACLKAKTQIVNAEKGGKITISFKSDDDLNRLIEIFKNGSN